MRKSTSLSQRNSNSSDALPDRPAHGLAPFAPHGLHMDDRDRLLERRGIGLRCFAFNPETCAFEGLDRPGRVDMDYRIELIRDPGVEVMTLPLGLGSVDHPYRPLQSRSPQCPRGSVPLVCAHEEGRLSEFVEEFLDATGQRRAHFLAFGRSTPLTRRGDRTLERGEPDQRQASGYASRTSCPTVTSPWVPASVARASPACELCAHTTIRDALPECRSRCETRAASV